MVIAVTLPVSHAGQCLLKMSERVIGLSTG